MFAIGFGAGSIVTFIVLAIYGGYKMGEVSKQSSKNLLQQYQREQYYWAGYQEGYEDGVEVGQRHIPISKN